MKQILLVFYPVGFLTIVFLQVAPSIKYLGTVLCPKGDGHLASDKLAAEKAFYKLQGAGLKFNGLNPETSVSIYRTAIQSITSIRCISIYLSQTKLKELDDVLQNKHLKAILGLKYSSHSTPLLKALSVLPVSALSLVNLNAVALLESCMTSNSVNGTFYSYLFKNKLMVKHSL